MNFSVTLPKALSFIAILFSLILVIPVFAKDATPASTTRKDLIQEKVGARKELVQAKQTAVQNLKAQMATREAALKTRLKTFRDQKKAVVAERVSTNLNAINTQRTDQMMKSLVTMTNILNKLETRVNSNAPGIKDPTAAASAIASARTSIASAEAAVTTQAANDYTLTISSEAKAKTEAQATRDKLHSDLKSVRVQVIAAKKAVSNAIRATRGLKAEEVTSGQ